MKRFLLSLAALLVLSGNGFCLDLQTAKAQGLVGETPTGYLAPVQAAHAEAKNLAQSINAQRKKQYLRIYTDVARKNEELIRYLVRLYNARKTSELLASEVLELSFSCHWPPHQQS